MGTRRLLAHDQSTRMSCCSATKEPEYEVVAADFNKQAQPKPKPKTGISHAEHQRRLQEEWQKQQLAAQEEARLRALAEEALRKKNNVNVAAQDYNYLATNEAMSPRSRAVHIQHKIHPVRTVVLPPSSEVVHHRVQQGDRWQPRVVQLPPATEVVHGLERHPAASTSLRNDTLNSNVVQQQVIHQPARVIPASQYTTTVVHQAGPEYTVDGSAKFSNYDSNTNNYKAGHQDHVSENRTQQSANLGYISPRGRVVSNETRNGQAVVKQTVTVSSAQEPLMQARTYSYAGSAPQEVVREVVGRSTLELASPRGRQAYNSEAQSARMVSSGQQYDSTMQQHHGSSTFTDYHPTQNLYDESSARFAAGASPRHSAREVTERRGVASGVTSTREVTEQISPRHSVRRDAYHVTQHHTSTQPAPEVSPAPVARTSELERHPTASTSLRNDTPNSNQQSSSVTYTTHSHGGAAFAVGSQEHSQHRQARRKSWAEPSVVHGLERHPTASTTLRNDTPNSNQN